MAFCFFVLLSPVMSIRLLVPKVPRPYVMPLVKKGVWTKEKTKRDVWTEDQDQSLRSGVQAFEARKKWKKISRVYLGGIWSGIDATKTGHIARFVNHSCAPGAPNAGELCLSLFLSLSLCDCTLFVFIRC